MKTERFNLMGEFEYISRNGQIKDISPSKDIGVIAILVLSKDYSCSRSKIIDLLWSDRCNEQGRSSLRHALWSLKKALPASFAEVLQADRKRVRLNPRLHSSDIADFYRLRESNVQQNLDRSVSLYRGELLEGLEIRDRAWNEWLGVERERLQLRYAETLCALRAHYLARTDIYKLLDIGRRLIEHDNLCGEGYRALMEGYSLLNQRSLALKQYHQYRDIVRKELNSCPEAGIRQLYERLKSGEILEANLMPAGFNERIPVPGW